MKERAKQLDPKRWLSDEVWAVLKAALQKVRNRQGPKQRQGDRDFLSAIAYLVKEGCSWRGLPPQFGHWHKRIRALSPLGKIPESNPLVAGLAGPKQGIGTGLVHRLDSAEGPSRCCRRSQTAVAMRLWDALMAD